MISDTQLLSAIEFDGASAGELRTCIERALIAEGNLKRVKAMEMRKHDHLPLGAQEREAYASEAYEAAMIEEARAAAALEYIKAARAHARLTIEIWRSMESLHRAVSRYP
jgi:hypothetical protein